MIKPIVEYDCTIWAPYTQKNIAIFESVQRRAARFVCNNYSPYASANAMLTSLQWPTLEHCRNQLKALTMFNIVHNLIDIPSNTSMKPAISHEAKLLNFKDHSQEYVNSYSFSFIPSAIKI